MNEIDFLPDRFREQSSKRRSQVWRIAVLLMLVGVVGVAALGQYAVKRSVTWQLAEFDVQHQAAEQRRLEYESLQKQEKLADATASLYAFLGARQYKTSILREIDAALSESLVLDGIRIEGLKRQGAGRFSREQGDSQKATAGLPPAVSDLRTLREDRAGIELTVSIIGHTNNTPDLHHFVSRLGRSALFSKAQLRSLSTRSENGDDESFAEATFGNSTNTSEGSWRAGPSENSVDAANAPNAERAEFQILLHVRPALGSRSQRNSVAMLGEVK